MEVEWRILVNWVSFQISFLLFLHFKFDVFSRFSSCNKHNKYRFQPFIILACQIVCICGQKWISLFFFFKYDFQMVSWRYLCLKDRKRERQHLLLFTLLNFFLSHTFTSIYITRNAKCYEEKSFFLLLLCFIYAWRDFFHKFIVKNIIHNFLC